MTHGKHYPEKQTAGVRIEFVGREGKRRSIRLGKVSQRFAEGIKLRVEDLVSAQSSGMALQPDTARWIGEQLDDTLYAHWRPSDCSSRVARLRCRPSARSSSNTSARRVDVKPATKEVWSQVTRNLLECYGEQRDLQTIDETAAEDFKLFLLKAKLALRRSPSDCSSPGNSSARRSGAS